MMRRAVLQILIRFEYRQWQSKLQGSNGIRTHGLRGSAAVLHQPSHENPYIESRPICWVHHNSGDFIGLENGNLSMRENLVMASAYARTSLRTVKEGLSRLCKEGDGESKTCST